MSRVADPADAITRPLVAIYRGTLINYNEVYIRTEVEALRRYRSFYLGVRRLREVDLPEERTMMLGEHYRSVDRVLDPLVTRIGWRLERVGPLAPLGRALAPGRVVGRASRYAFQVHGVSPTLVRTLRSLRPAVLHAYTSVSGAHALPLARKLRIPLVVSEGGYASTATDEEMQQDAQYGRVFLRRREAMKREVQLTITISDFLRRQLVERGWPAEKIVVMRGGIDPEHFTPDWALPLARRAPVVFFAGRLIEVKGITYLLRAMHEVQQRIPDAEVVIAGAGPLRTALEQEARELGIRARFLGSAPPEEIHACHAQAQVYCMPSVTSATGQQEGLSYALLEAMSSGLPVVGSASGGIPEAIGDAGFLVPERDVSALAERLVALLSDPALRERMGAASRQRIKTHFDLRKQVSQLESLYDRARREYAAAHPTARRSGIAQ